MCVVLHRFHGSNGLFFRRMEMEKQISVIGISYVFCVLQSASIIVTCLLKDSHPLIHSVCVALGITALRLQFCSAIKNGSIFIVNTYGVRRVGPDRSAFN